ncbi:MAG: fibronectin type III domain-containing protein, partial [Candidatus Marinimicrobia bacterium]|nr:fibronectin type III domain-containing protein [Candidatus Neomarinimicrobiota bacterium]
TTSKTNTGLSNGVTYYFGIRYRGNDNTTGAFSNIVGVVPDYSGPDWFVSNSGNDGTGDGSSTSPFATIQTAINKSSDGDTINIDPGTYDGSGNYNLTLDSKALTIVGTGGSDSVEIDISGDSYNKRRFALIEYLGSDCNIDVSHDVEPNGATDGSQRGQSFTAETAGYLSKVKFHSYNGDQAASSYLKIREWNSDTYAYAFYGSELATSDTPVDYPSNNDSWQDLSTYTFSSPAYVEAGQKYVIEIINGQPYVAHGSGYEGGEAYETLNPNNDRDFPFVTTVCSSYDVDTAGETVIKGLSIVNGYAPDGEGGAFKIKNSGDVTIDDCVIGPNNVGTHGGAINIDNTDVTIKNSRIKGNYVTSSSYSVSGGAVYISNNSSSAQTVNIEKTVLRNNSVYVSHYNYPDLNGGAMTIQGVNNDVLTVNLSDCILLDNEVTQPSSSNGSSRGGAIYAHTANLNIVHSTIVDNSSKVGDDGANGRAGAINAGPSSNLNILNSILWGNEASNINEEMLNVQDAESVSINHSSLQESYSGTSNLTGDPTFVNAGNNNFALSTSSPLLGAGAPTGQGIFTLESLISSTDLAGNARPGSGGGNPDMGALENALATSPVPDAPTGLTATAGDGEITLSWTANSETDIAKYGIYYGTSTAPSVKEQEVSSGTTVTITGLSNNVTYYFRITAINSGSYESGFSAEVTGAPQFSGEDIYVNGSATGSEDGSSTYPYHTIQDAISASATTDGKRILVAAGTYTFDAADWVSNITVNFSYSGNWGNQSGSFITDGTSITELNFTHSSNWDFPSSSWTIDENNSFYTNIGTFRVEATSPEGTNFELTPTTVSVEKSSGTFETHDNGWSLNIWEDSQSSGSGNNPIIDLLGKQIVIESISGSDSTVIDGQGDHTALRLDASENEYNGYSNSTKFIGFTFTNGDDEEPLIYIEGPSDLSSALNWAPTFENCRFTNTTIDNVDPITFDNVHGVIEIKNAEPVFDGCEFRNLNTSINQDLGGGYDIAGPIRMKGTESSSDTTAFRPVFKNCVIAENSLVNTYNSYNSSNFKGGAIYIGYGAIPLFENTRIDSNKIDIGSGVSNWNSHHNAYGGGIYVDNYMSRGEAVKFINTSISYNEINGEAVYGGGIFSKFPALEFTNALLVGNSIDASYANSDDGWIETVGGAIRWATDLSIYVPSNLSTDPELLVVNSTIVGNSITPNSYDVAGASGSGICRENTNNHDVVIFNSIITNNSITNVDDQTRINLATNYGSWSNNNSLIDFSIIEYFSDSGLEEDNLMDIDPNFTSSSDYSLAASSVAIGAGTDSYEGINAPAFDYNSNSRPNPSGSNPDLGAYENTLSTTPYPAKPQNLAVDAEGDSTVTLSWTANSEDDLSEYKIYYGTSSATTLLDSVSGTPSYTASGLDNYTTYYFAVSAEDLDGYESAKSNEVSGTPKWSGPIWYVDANQSSGTGKDGSPTLPFREIQDAIDAVDPSSRIDGLKDTVLVLPGSYDRSDDQELYFKYTSGTNQGQPKNLVLKSRDGAATTILDGEGNNRLFNIVDKTDTTLQIIGFTILGGGENDGMGNAIKVVGQSYWDNNTNQQVTTTSGTTFKNCIIKENGTVGTPEASPVIYLDRAKVRFIDCIIENNHVTKSGFNAEGGAIRASGDSRLTIFRTKILDNSLTGSSTEASGAGVYMDGSGNNQLTVINSVIARNTATAGSGYPSRGAGITVGGGVATIINSTIVDNNNNDENQFENGAGVYITYGNSGTTTNFNLFNSIIYGNTPLQNQLQINGWLDINHFVSYSILQGGNVDEYEDGVFEANPEFSDNTYVLHERSPAIGAGETESEDVDGNVIYPPTNDLAGNGRPNPAGSNPDLGAYEHEL